MSNQSLQQLSTAEFNANMIQAMQNGQTMNGVPNMTTQQGFQNYHQAFQRLQSQQAGKIEQQRLGVGLPGQQPQPNLGNGNVNSQQQFLEMMQQAQSQGQVAPVQNQGMQMNVHSAQQGPAIPGMPDTEAERRQLLHKWV
jgi:hypothetical protein